MKKIKRKYRVVFASALKVHLAFAKKENVTATQKAARLDIDWLAPLAKSATKTAQWISVLITPTDIYLANNRSIA